MTQKVFNNVIKQIYAKQNSFFEINFFSYKMCLFNSIQTFFWSYLMRSEKNLTKFSLKISLAKSVIVMTPIQIINNQFLCLKIVWIFYDLYSTYIFSKAISSQQVQKTTLIVFRIMTHHLLTVFRSSHWIGTSNIFEAK